MGPSAKRPKRLVISSSDDDRDDTGTDAKHVVEPGQHKGRKPRLKRAHVNDTSKPSLPTRSRERSSLSKTQVVPERSSKHPPRQCKVSTSNPISTYFSAANQAEALVSRQRSRSAAPEVDKGSGHELGQELEDLIEDDTSIDEDIAQGKPQLVTRSTHLRPSAQTVNGTSTKPGDDSLLAGSQRFKPSEKSAQKSQATFAPTVDTRPWAERFGPNSLEELVVHKKKVSDIRGWLENVLEGRGRQTLLVLKGPSGAGKTATISLLARFLQCELSEWRSPVGSEYLSEGYQSMSAHFEEFLGRSNRFGRLEISENAGKTTELSNGNSARGDLRRKIILIEEFPNTILSSSNVLRAFQSSVLEYLAVSTPPMGAILSRASVTDITPMVVIITETRLTTTTAASDNFTAHRLLGSDILSHPGVRVIEFNPIAPTLLTKALDLVIQKEARQSGRRRIPGPSVLKQLGEVGDVRSAIGSLEFLCLRGGDGNDWGGRVASRTKKGSKASSVITKMEKETLEMVTQRESSLGLFHAVGKVVYNKRDDVTEPVEQPPNHLPEYVRQRVSQVSTDSLIDETGTDTETFVAALHENFVLSCEGVSFMDSINDCLGHLSDSDILGSPRSGRYGSSGQYGSRSFQGAGSDSLRQDEMCFQLAVRGLLFSLPDPVKRTAHPTASKGGEKRDSHKMFYPTSMRLSRQTEEIDSLISRWTDHLRAGTILMRQLSTESAYLAAPAMSDRWKSPHNKCEVSAEQLDQEESEQVRMNLNATKPELVLERLPYIAIIEKHNRASLTRPDLEKITQFQGIGILNTEASEDDVDNEVLETEWTTDRPAVVNFQGQSVRHGLKETASIVLPEKDEAEKLYLSDDDIED